MRRYIMSSARNVYRLFKKSVVSRKGVLSPKGQFEQLTFYVSKNIFIKIFYVTNVSFSVSIEEDLFHETPPSAY